MAGYCWWMRSGSVRQPRVYSTKYPGGSMNMRKTTFALIAVSQKILSVSILTAADTDTVEFNKAVKMVYN